MDRGTYIAASAGLLQLRKLDVVNNNLANTNTPGFKRELLVSEMQSFDKTFAKAVEAQDPYAKGDHNRMPATVDIRTTTDFSLGPIANTSNPMDVALKNPNDFFVISTPKGNKYTRAGNFTLNSGGEIVTADGYQVVGDGGPITTSGLNVAISANGSVRAGNELVGNLQVVRFDDPSKLAREGSSRFTLASGAKAPTPVEADLHTSSLEMSNVTAIGSVIDLITANRAFELYTKSSSSIDQLNQMAISQIGKVR